jgi:hypothetical protein
MKKRVSTIKAQKKPRQGWGAFFKLMRARGENRLSIPDTLDVSLRPAEGVIVKKDDKQKKFKTVLKKVNKDHGKTLKKLAK